MSTHQKRDDIGPNVYALVKMSDSRISLSINMGNYESQDADSDFLRKNQYWVNVTCNASIEYLNLAMTIIRNLSTHD